jgi:tRNA(adenine34) deaminase
MISFMDQALIQAQKAGQADEIPVGAVITYQGKIIAEAGNEIFYQNDPTAHAEIVAIRRACQALGQHRLDDCALYVTLEPCPMCAAAIALARIQTIYFGAYDPKGGGIDHGPRIYQQSSCHHRPHVVAGVQEQACSQLLKDFFVKKR